jgi:hypothetical protein
VNVEYSLLGIYPASEFYKPTFRNPVSVPSSWVGRKMEPTRGSETLAYKIWTPGKFPEDYILGRGSYKPRPLSDVTVRYEA